MRALVARAKKQKRPVHSNTKSTGTIQSKNKITKNKTNKKKSNLTLDTQSVFREIWLT